MLGTTAIAQQLDASRVAQDRFGRFQQSFTLLTALVLVPGLVAAVFGANVELPFRDSSARAMWIAMVVGAALTLLVLMLLGRRR